MAEHRGKPQRRCDLQGLDYLKGFCRSFVVRRMSASSVFAEPTHQGVPGSDW
jgi:hypothetical protein